MQLISSYQGDIFRKYPLFCFIVCFLIDYFNIPVCLNTTVSGMVVSALVWNPAINNMFVVSFKDGSLAMYTIKVCVTYSSKKIQVFYSLNYFQLLTYLSYHVCFNCKLIKLVHYKENDEVDCSTLPPATGIVAVSWSPKGKIVAPFLLPL